MEPREVRAHPAAMADAAAAREGGAAGYWAEAVTVVGWEEVATEVEMEAEPAMGWAPATRVAADHPAAGSGALARKPSSSQPSRHQRRFR